MNELDTKLLASRLLNDLPKALKEGTAHQEVVVKLNDLLHGDRQIARACLSQLITHEEAANVLVAHIHSWLVDKSGHSWDDMFELSDLVSDVEKALSKAYG